MLNAAEMITYRLAVDIMALVMFGTITTILVRQARRRARLDTVPMIAYFAHVTLFYAVLVGARLARGYVGPAEIFTFWSTVIRFQLGISFLGMFAVRRLYPLYRRPHT